MIVIINEELKEIGAYALYCCGSLQRIAIPDAVRVINDLAHRYSTGLTTVTLGDGLEESWGVWISSMLITSKHRNTPRRQGN